MLSRIITCCEICQILILSPLKVKSLHLLSKFVVVSLMVLEKDRFENCQMKNSLSTLTKQSCLQNETDHCFMSGSI